MKFVSSNTIFGAVHLLPTPGFEGFPGKEVVVDTALKDLESLEKGGIDGIVIENNYDLPHQITIKKETENFMSDVINLISLKTKLPIGISILWNSYESALNLALKHDCEFVRVPVFVDHVMTDFGEIVGKSEKVVGYRKNIGAENVKLFTDIQVKHSELLNKRPISDAAEEAIQEGSDGVIVTGKWTGDAPDLNKLENVYNSVGGKVPVIIGSGANEENIKDLLKFSDMVIVSTALKEGESSSKERNVKGYNQRVDSSKVKSLTSRVKKIREKR